MNHNSNLPVTLRTLVIYAICVPLAVLFGYMLAPQSIIPQSGGAGLGVSVLNYFAMHWVLWTILFLLMCAPILLRWHNLLLVACWNMPLMLFFLPGRPMIWLLVACLSLGISILHRTINSEAHFLSARQITVPLFFLIAVVLFTAKMTGGIGLHSFGSEVSGGKKYIFLTMAVLGYFALTARRIPPQWAKLYVVLFFAGGLLAFIEDLAPYVPGSFYFLFAFFPVSAYDLNSGLGTAGRSIFARFAGFGMMGEWGFFLMLARYGIRGIFLSGKPWRLVVFGIFSACLLLGGFRSVAILCGMAFVIQFFLERMQATKAFPVFIFCGLVGATLIVPFADKLPYTFQRSLAFLPLKIDPAVKRNALDSEIWRLQVWKDTLPKVPQHLLLGKGYALSAQDLAAASNQSFHYVSNAEVVDIVGNYHSGPLSVVIPFGIWGVIAVLWFWAASLNALYRNSRYGDSSLSSVNKFLFAWYIAKIILFLIIFGDLASDMVDFVAIIGLSVSLNGGICKRAPKPLPVSNEASIIPVRMRFQPFFRR